MNGMNKADRLQVIRDTGIIAIVRARSSEQLIPAAAAIREGGVRVIEVSMTTPGALEVIAEATGRLGPDVLLGAGTVLDAETARAAILAGAGLIVAPTLDVDVIRLCNQQGVVAVPGCYTPTEMLLAYRAGADLIKFFPAEAGGAAMLRSIRAPLPHLQIVPVGGVTLDNATEYIRSGAAALGVGSALINESVLEAADWRGLSRRADAFIQAVKRGRDK